MMKRRMIIIQPCRQVNPSTGTTKTRPQEVGLEQGEAFVHEVGADQVSLNSDFAQFILERAAGNMAETDAVQEMMAELKSSYPVPTDPTELIMAELLHRSDIIFGGKSFNQALYTLKQRFQSQPPAATATVVTATTTAASASVVVVGAAQAPGLCPDNTATTVALSTLTTEQLAEWKRRIEQQLQLIKDFAHLLLQRVSADTVSCAHGHNARPQVGACGRPG